MPHVCPNCSAEVPGVVPTETMTKRLAAKDGEISALRGKVSELEPVAARASAAERELAETREAVEVSGAFGAIGVPADDTVRKGFRAIYDSEMAGVDDGARVSFAAWLAGDAPKQHPLLRGAFGSTSPAAPPPAPNAPVSPPRVAASAEAGVVANPPAAPRMTPRELAEYFRSPEYRAKSKEERAADRVRLASELK